MLKNSVKRYYSRKTDLPENIVWKTKLMDVTSVKKVVKEPFVHHKWTRDAGVESSIGKVFEFEKNQLLDIKNISNSLARQVHPP